MGHSISQSPFYMLKSKKRLAEILGFQDFKDFKKFVLKGCAYIQFEKEVKGKIRTIDTPNKKLDVLHSKIFGFIKRIDTPEYLHSGVKGRSYISNAEAHVGPFPLCTLDIKSFYPSTTFTYVYNCFLRVFLCSPDISFLLTKISICGEYLPTGSCLSQLLAFYCHKTVFDEINERSEAAGFTMTCYVDDLTVSGHGLTKQWVFDNVKKILTSSGLSYHKEKFYAESQKKLITGVIVDIDGIKVRNHHHHNIYMSFKDLLDDNVEDKRKAYRRILGQLSAAGQIEEKFINIREHLKPKKILFDR